MSPNPPHPMSCVGVLLSPRGGDCEPSSTVLQSTPATDSAAIALQQMARRRKRPRRHPGRRNRPRAPSPPDEAIPSHPLPTMGGTSTPTTTLTSARANDRAPRSHQPSLQVLQATTAHNSAAVTLHRTACRHKRPRCRPSCRNVPRAPNPPDEATPSHPQPTMGGTSPPTLSNLTSARANNRAPRSHLSPSLQHFTIEGATSTYSGGGIQ